MLLLEFILWGVRMQSLPKPVQALDVKRSSQAACCVAPMQVVLLAR